MTGKTNQKESIKNPSRIEEKYLDKLHIRVTVKKNSKEPSLEDWINYHESRKINELLKVGNYGLRTGKKLGNYYFCALDIDRHGERYHFSQISYIEGQRSQRDWKLVKKND